MLDSKYFRREIEITAAQLARRGFNLDVEKINKLEAKRKKLQTTTQALQNQLNRQAKAIGKAKAAGQDISLFLAAVEKISSDLKVLEKQNEKVLSELKIIRLTVPNILHHSVPDGVDETDNVEVRRCGATELPAITIKDHVELGQQLGMMDFTAATKITGARFVVLKSALAKLQRALGQFMLDMHTKAHHYTEVYVPYLVNEASLYGTGQLPKFANEQFKLTGEAKYSLIPTAEVPVTNLVRNEILDATELPLKYVAQTPCFRSEAGSYGKDTRGLIRQHQFEKVEMVRIVKPQDSYQHLEELVQNGEAILQKLALPYRVVALCAGDTGFSSAKTYDIEVWFPSQQTYREISSCSNFADFQARRLQARWRNPETNKTEFVHTLNGSGLPLGRTLAAIMENYQCDDGSIFIPQVLRPYLDGLQKIQ